MLYCKVNFFLFISVIKLVVVVVVVVVVGCISHSSDVDVFRFTHVRFSTSLQIRHLLFVTIRTWLLQKRTLLKKLTTLYMWPKIC